ncbi:hypothetical protein N7533_011032 [Penicillium manginii]|uniref:uncharacterized protein n=1 Tax=Penicillium manginii TaxID=203109 RepID=UPI002549BADA|nr:uncharacterized protein N7533_011032 [Penicillium manginii]KAJ5741623.1 hypothetical protein N7533_011032 [Penicillium manginii]
MNANTAVMQWLRHREYAGPNFERALGEIDRNWITFVEIRNITMIDWVADPLQPISIKVAHLGASLEGVTLISVKQGLAMIRDPSLNISDLLGWGGDLITFYVDWQYAMRASKTPISGYGFCLDRLAQPAYKKEYIHTAKLRDLVEDADAYNIGTVLNRPGRRTIVQEIEELFRPGGGYTNRFARFWQKKLGGSVETATKLADHLLSTNGVLDGIAMARRDLIVQRETFLRIAPPITRPELLNGTEREGFCRGFAEVMQQLASSG